MGLKIAVLVSGSGTNLQALIDACREDDFPAEIVLVLSNKQDAYALNRAKEAGIPTEIINHTAYDSREVFDQAMDKAITSSGADFVCLAGFMRLLTPWFVDKWYTKLINIHPSILPAFKGVNAQKQAVEAGVKVTGCTVHFVTKDMDAGPIIVQDTIEILSGDTEQDVQSRLLPKEHSSYVQALKLIGEGRVRIQDNKVVID